ncbi:MAG: PAS domain S-box protein [Verrucomicrobiae bacterium]|nr:PAS domain S-box protein [Verrucomicrobiae bacterium]
MPEENKASNKRKKRTTCPQNNGKTSSLPKDSASKYPIALASPAEIEECDFFRAIFKGSDDAIVCADTTGTIFLWNKAAERIFGINQSEAIGKKLEFILDRENKTENGKLRELFKNCEGIQSINYEYVRKDNKSVKLMLTVIPVGQDNNNTLIGIAVVARDVTVQRTAEEKLRASEAFYHSLVETLPQNIFRKDLEGRFTFANKRFCQSLGIRLENLVGKSDFDFYPPELAKKYSNDDQHVIKTGKTFETIEEHQPPGGNKMYVQVCKTPILDADGRIIGIQGIFWDITEQKLAKDKLIEANIELEKRKQELLKALNELEKSHEELKAAQNLLIQAERMESVGRLAAGVAHEVKNPLAIIQSGIDYLRQTEAIENETVASVIQDMREALVRADGVVRGMLDFAASQELGVNSENLNAIMETSLNLLKHDLNRNKITVVKNFSSTLPQILADRTRIEQVLVNLIMNSMHAMPHGGVLTVRTYSRVIPPEEAPGETQMWGLRRFEVGETVVVAEIEDTGSGIPKEVMARLFEPFCTSKKSSKGTGLGLAVAKKIMEMHGGEIQITNRPEGGVLAKLTFRANIK